MPSKLAVFGLLSAALLISSCGPTTINQAAQPQVRSLTIVGVGDVSLAPELARINIGVHTETESVAESVASNNAKTEALASAFKAAGIEDQDMVTSNFTIWQNTQYNQEGQQVGTTYVVDNSVQVTVRDLDSLGDLLDAAIRAGANNINSIQFDVADRTDGLKEARDEAVANARAQAQELATAAGVKLGKIQTISYVQGASAAFQPGKGGGGAGGEGGPVPLEAGLLTLTATVNIVYEIQ